MFVLVDSSRVRWSQVGRWYTQYGGNAVYEECVVVDWIILYGRCSFSSDNNTHTPTPKLPSLFGNRLPVVKLC